MSEHVGIRFELLQRLKLELVGPNRIREQLGTKERPTQRYLAGLLWPQNTEIDQGENEKFDVEESGEEGGGSAEAMPPLQQSMNPSSMGLSFVVASDCKQVRLTASWGEYVETLTPKGDAVWQREPKKMGETIEFPGELGKRQMSPVGSDVVLEWLVRRLGDHYAVSVFLVNRRIRPENEALDLYCLFQPQIRVRGVEEETLPFAARESGQVPTFERPKDVMSDELIYRDETVFAVGHGTAVKWMNVSSDHQRAGQLKTTVLPYYEIPRVVPPDWTEGGSLDMKVLANAKDGQEVEKLLTPLADAYALWIQGQKARLKNFEGDMLLTANRHITQCEDSLKRIKEGIQLIHREPLVFRAFQFANRAMADQRTQALWAREARKSEDWSKGPKPVRTEWRPFQIGFILQALTGVFDPTHNDRQIADLLWFPTGGGKTEAYLGLAAFVMGLRRMRGEVVGHRGDVGVNVIMRYTLRLLTIQQFQRAATLICACERIRQEDPVKWGDTPFRIGLWVGRNSSPNNFDDCVKVLKPRKKTGSTTQSTPVQLVSCPWCGSQLLEKHYIPDESKRRLIIGCSRKACEFSRYKNAEGIPALVEDEEIYRLVPTLLIGTVDKFARMPWVGETQAIFGQVKAEIEGWGFITEGEYEDSKEVRNSTLQKQGLPNNIKDERRLLPPELIIQDELHLIGGPLGTMVGLYESAIDWLSSVDEGEKVRLPKVVASTATIRRADQQVRKLFARDLAIFPSPGLDAGDSFFAVEQPLEKVPGRLYAGIYAPGRSIKTALVRVYASMLASTPAMDRDERDLDTYQTLVGYFNSLRELGGAVRLLEDDVHSRMNVLENRQNAQQFKFLARQMGAEIPELTSRIDSRLIPVTLEQLERPFLTTTKEKPVDVVLASNMISVGVDVSRLGLMVVTGQPKTTSEYIQATSRVGREFPGLVLTVFNWARPRDVSHYERFHSYHAAQYRYVEAISVTPYSSRARDRGLAAAFISMSRIRSRGLAPRNGASKFSMNSQDSKLIRERLLARVRQVEGAKRQAEVEEQLKKHMEQWDDSTGKDFLVYTGSNKYPRLMRSLGTPDDGSTFAVPNSMRDVEPTIGIYLKRGD